ncbi:MAG: hypothetical protein JXA10_06435 [Anaerolineae bacterium]|nr:hypothetical protein [Anaerolineae bacterium]
MRLAIQPDMDYTESYYPGWIDALTAQGIDHRLVDVLNPGWREALNSCDGLMWRVGHSPFDRAWGFRVLYTINTYLNLPIYPGLTDLWHYDEKLSQAYLFEACDIPTPRTYAFSDMQRALAWAQSAQYPQVFKLSTGSASIGVRKVESVAEAERLIRLMFCEGITLGNWIEQPSRHTRLRRIASRIKQGMYRHLLRQQPRWPLGHWHWPTQANYVIFQDFIPDNSYDTRITVIGERAFGFRRWNRGGDFRASGSGQLDHDPAQIKRACIATAFEAAQKLGTRCMSFDFVLQDGVPLITEMSWTFLAAAIRACPGHWRPDLTWVEGQLWPQQAQVDDFIALIRKET